MPGTPVDVGHGTAVIFATTGFTAQLTGLRLLGMARRALDASHMSVTAATAQQFGNRPYVRGRLVDPGAMQMSIHFNPQTNPPLHAPPEAIRILWPLAPLEVFAHAWDCMGFLTTLAITDSLDDLMVGEVTVKLTSVIDTSGSEASILWNAPWEYGGFGDLVTEYTAPWEYGGFDDLVIQYTAPWET